jgi:hypothetical protein
MFKKMLELQTANYVSRGEKVGGKRRQENDK